LTKQLNNKKMHKNKNGIHTSTYNEDKRDHNKLNDLQSNYFYEKINKNSSNDNDNIKDEVYQTEFKDIYNKIEEQRKKIWIREPKPFKIKNNSIKSNKTTNKHVEQIQRGNTYISNVSDKLLGPNLLNIPNFDSPFNSIPTYQNKYDKKERIRKSIVSNYSNN